MHIDNADIEPCSLTKEQRQQMRTHDGSHWLINNTTLYSLDNDPQKLIECTRPGDRVVFNLTGVQNFTRTLVVVHDLDFVSESDGSFTYSSRRRFLTIKYAVSELLFSPKV